MRSLRLVFTVISLFLAFMVKGQDCDSIAMESAVTFEFITPSNISSGDNFCVAVTVENFIDVAVFEFTMTFDPSVLEFLQIIDAGSPLIGPIDANTTINENGLLVVIWTNLNAEGQTLDDGSQIFSICFTAVGEPNECSVLSMTDAFEPTFPGLEVGISTSIFNPICPDTLEFTPAEICLACNALSLSAFYCNSNTGNGSITVSACGGLLPYNLTITGPSTSASGTISNPEDTYTLDNLAAGFYTVVLTDGTGNSVQDDIFIDNVSPLSFDLVTVNPACNGGRGYILVENINFPNSDINWSTGAFGLDSLRLSEGSYSVTVTDENGCMAVQTTTIFTEPLTAQIQIDSASCQGGNDGVIQIAASGGTPFSDGSYIYQNQFQVPSYQDVSADEGFYPIRIVDANGCLFETDTIIPLQDSLLASVSVIDVPCYGDSTGSAVISMNLPGQYSFLPRDTSGNFYTDIFGVVSSNSLVYDNRLPAITLNIEIRDQIRGCETDATFTIDQAPELFFSGTSTDPTCLDQDGTIETTASGGTGPYTYSWSHDTTLVEGALDSLLSGTFDVTMTDANGCTESLQFQLNGDKVITVDAQIIDPLNCDGTGQGLLRANVTTSAANLSYTWLNAASIIIGTEQDLIVTSGGTYIIEVTDEDANCSVRDTVSIIPSGAFTFEVSATDPTCPGGIDGSISFVNIMGGVAPFTFNWSGFGEVGPVVTNLEAGDYAVLISDSDNCAIDTTVTLVDPDPISLVVQDIDGTSCFNGNDGQATAIAGNSPTGATDFFYFWSNSDDDDMGETDDAAALPSGQNYVIAFDGSCTSDTVYFNVPQPDQIQLDAANSLVSDPLCYDECTGTADLAASGGISATGVYAFTWENGADTETRNDLCEGLHYISIEDDNGCMEVDSIFLGQPDSLSLEIDPNLTSDLSCFGSNSGSIGVFASGGTGDLNDFSYIWSGNESTSNLAENLGAGMYSITVSDQNGCTATVTYELQSSTPIVADIGQPPLPACFGGSTCLGVDGVTGGVPGNYTFSINFGNRFPIDTCIDVIAGMYTITIFDAAGCSFQEMIQVEQPPQLIVDLGTDISLELGDTSAVLTADITSALDIFSIDWNSNAGYSCIDPLCSMISIAPTGFSSYAVTVTDENGCTAVDDINVDVKAERNIFAPNAFSPNGDGYNDRFMLFTGKGIVQINFLNIYDRWGNLVWSEENIPAFSGDNAGWDGRYGGREAQPGVYVYYAEVLFVDNQVIEYKGDITLIR